MIKPTVENTLLDFQSSHSLRSKIEGKRVVIVGPLPLPDQHDLIEGYDVVVRVKRGFPVPQSLQKDVGTRTDLLYTNLRDSQNWVRPRHLHHAASSGVHFCYPYPSDRPKVLRSLRLDENYYHNYNLFVKQPIPPGFAPVQTRLPLTHCFNAKRYNSLEYSEVGCRPTTGLLAIIHLLEYNPSSLHVTGFTFRHDATKQYKSSLYHDSYKTDAEARESWDRTVKTPVHDIEREIAYMRRLLYRDYRITVDSRLREIFYGSVNLVMSRITAISSFYPLIQRLTTPDPTSPLEKPVKVRVFLHPNPKPDFDPFGPTHLQYLQNSLLPLGVEIYHTHYLSQYRGLTFVVEGDMVGWKDWKKSSAIYWSRKLHPYSRFYTVSLINCWDFVKNINRYQSHLDHVAIPEYYRDYYELHCPRLIPYGNPKFDYPFEDWDRDTLMAKYGFPPDTSKILLFLYPKSRAWTSPPPDKYLYRLIRLAKQQGYYVVVKSRGQDPFSLAMNKTIQNYPYTKTEYGYSYKPNSSTKSPHSALPTPTPTYDNPDYYGDYIVPRDVDWIPPTTFELLRCASLVVQFSSASVEESVYVGCPVIDMKIDPTHDRFSFLLTREWVSRIDMIPPVDKNKWERVKSSFKKSLDREYSMRWDRVDELGLPRREISQTLITKFLK